jgi:hypothetical protein
MYEMQFIGNVKEAGAIKSFYHNTDINLSCEDILFSILEHSIKKIE